MKVMPFLLFKPSQKTTFHLSSFGYLQTLFQGILLFILPHIGGCVCLQRKDPPYAHVCHCIVPVRRLLPISVANRAFQMPFSSGKICFFETFANKTVIKNEKMPHFCVSGIF